MDLTAARGRHHWLFALVITVLLPSLPAHAQVGNPPHAQQPASSSGLSLSEADRLRLFQSVFVRSKSAQATSQTLALPLLIDGFEAGQIRAKAAPGGTGLQIELSSIVAVIAPLVEAGLLARLTARAGPDGLLDLTDLEREGLSVRFDIPNLVLILALPAQLRRLKVVNFGLEAQTIDTAGIVPTAKFSSYVNLFGSLDFMPAANGLKSSRQANLALDGAANLKGTVFEWSLMYLNSAQQQFQRGDLRLVRDDPARALRYSVGDLSYPVTGFQSFVPMAGIAVARNFSLQPYFLTQPTGSQEFVLNQESQVEVFVNGIQNRTLTLPAGRYNFRNFQFTDGANDVELRATDSVGRVSTIASPFFYSSNLLAAGVEEFSYSAGKPSTIGTSLRTYDDGPFSVSGFHRLGLSDTLTIGGNFQGSVAQQQLGGEFTFASEFGAIHMDITGSHQKGTGFVGAVRLAYNLIDPQSSGSSLLAQATYISPNFSSLGTVRPRNPTALDLGVRYTKRILTDVYASVGASYQVGRDGQDNRRNLNFSLQRSFTRGLTANLRVDRSVEQRGRSSFGALFALSWQLGDGHSFVQSSYDTVRDTQQVSYRYSPSNFVGEPGGALNVVRRGNEEQLAGSLFYNANRFESALSHDAIFPSSDSQREPIQRTSLRAGTSLVFADGHFGVGRPIRDSFAIVVPNENYADQEIQLDSSGTTGGYGARTGFLGAAVLPDLSAYQIRSLLVTVTDLPLGYQLGQDRFHLIPNYRSGTVIVVGNDATVVLDGTLLDRTGAPLALLAGEIAALDPKGAPIGQFFTNRQGRFRIEGVGPGSYELRLVQYPSVNARVVIPAATKGVYAVGEVRLAMEIEI